MPCVAQFLGLDQKKSSPDKQDRYEHLGVFSKTLQKITYLFVKPSE
jgi:hypothetical protein